MFTITHKPFFLYTKQFEKSEINKKTFSHCSDKEDDYPFYHILAR